MLVLIVGFLTACYEDEGNYTYKDLSAPIIDTTGLNLSVMSAYPGDTVEVSVNILYDKPENLQYYWLLVDDPYESVLTGNDYTFPDADTIGWEADLSWIVDVEPGWYRYYLMVVDTVNSLSDYMWVGPTQYFTVNSSSSFYGLMCLAEYDGVTDIDVFYSPLPLIFGHDTEAHFYSNKYGATIPGAPVLISYSAEGYFYTFTDQTGLRLDASEYLTMEDYDDMFYAAPTENIQAYQEASNNELLINDGKLHVLNNNKGNDRKFSAAIGGDYDAFPFISHELDDEICVVFDKESLSFMRYYSEGSTLVPFGTGASGAVVSPNNLPNVPLAIMTYGDDKTCAIVEDTDNVLKAFLYNFNSTVEGDYSAEGSRSKIDLSGCEDIDEATMFYAGYTATAFHYATADAVYAFSISSGATEATKIYDVPTGEVVTCIYSIPSGGFPTAARVYWIATWNDTTKEGTIVEFEIDPNSGEPDLLWGGYFGVTENPTINTGFGKITSMRVGL